MQKINKGCHMKTINELRPCYICHSLLTDSNVVSIASDYKRIARIWFGVCDCCQEHYPEIMEVIKRSVDLDDLDNNNYTVVFNLLDSVKAYRYGCRFIPQFRGKNKC